MTKFENYNNSSSKKQIKIKSQLPKHFSLSNLVFEKSIIGIYLSFEICFLVFHKVYVEYFLTSLARSRAFPPVTSSSFFQKRSLWSFISVCTSSCSKM